MTDALILDFCPELTPPVTPPDKSIWYASTIAGRFPFTDQFPCGKGSCSHSEGPNADRCHPCPSYAATKAALEKDHLKRIENDALQYAKN